MAKEPVIVVLAAGLGSRYGGIKQITPVGSCREKLLDYSLYDAKMAGFKKVVFVIREDLLADFETEVFKNIRPYMEVEYVFQKQDAIPAGFSIPEGRVKPWGTAHAVLSTAELLHDTPFAVINADDFYGRQAFHEMYHFLASAKDGEKMQFSMVGYQLSNTVTENGTVSRGVCESENGYLTTVTERTKIAKRENGIAYTEDDGETWVPLADETVVSMNLFGFTPGIFNEMKQRFVTFFEQDVPKNPKKAEFLLPFVVNDLVAEGKATVRMLSSSDRWYGVTYKEDRAAVVEGIKKLSKAGIYPTPLWQ